MALIPYEHVLKSTQTQEEPVILSGLPAQEFYCGDAQCDCATANIMLAGIPVTVDLGTARVDYADGQTNQARQELAQALRAELEQGKINPLREHYAKTREYGRVHHFRYVDWTPLKQGEVVGWQQVYRGEAVPLFTMTLAPPAKEGEAAEDKPAETTQLHIGLGDSYCIDPKCDCKRVIWSVLSAPRPDGRAVQTLGQVSYSFVTHEHAVMQCAQSVHPNQLFLLVHNLLKAKPEIAAVFEQRYAHLRKELTPLLAAQRRNKGQARAGQEIGRNETCPCGSGKKFKKCHGATTAKAKA